MPRIDHELRPFKIDALIKTHAKAILKSIILVLNLVVPHEKIYAGKVFTFSGVNQSAENWPIFKLVDINLQAMFS